MLNRTLALAAVVTLVGVVAVAQPAAGRRVVALSPLSTLGAEDTSASSKKLTQQIEQALAALPNTKVITAAQVAQAIIKAKKPALRTCERDPACLAELGRLVGATYVIDGEVGGLPESKIVYLGATDVASGKELRSTTLQVGSKPDAAGGTAGAAARLLDPERYKGTLHLKIDAQGATVYINGSKVTLDAKGEYPVLVGTQALRITHPEYRDFVRFIDIPYGKTLDVPVNMTQYPMVSHDLQGKPLDTDHVVYDDPPRWRRPIVIVPVAIIVAVGVGLIVGHYTHALPAHDACRYVGGELCP